MYKEHFEHTYEVCPHCEEEVELDAELKVQTCPNCGARIVTCSMCRANEAPGHYCATCCLCYQAEQENKELEEINRMSDPKHQFTEVRCDFFDEVTGRWCVDAWGKYVDDGEVVAFINPDTLEVTYNKPEFAKDELVFEAVRMKLRDILNELAVK